MYKGYIRENITVAAVVLFIIIQIISINIIYPSSSKKIACDCYNQSVLKSGRAYDDMSRNEQIFREKCFQEFKTEEGMKRASIFFPKKYDSFCLKLVGANFSNALYTFILNY